MRNNSSKNLLARAMTMAGLLCVSTPGFADGKAPMQIPPSLIGGKGLDKIAPWPAQIVMSGGDAEHKLSEVFSGEFVAGIYQSKPTKLAINDPWPFDEYVQILSGELHLTDVSGKTRVFPTGSHVVVPKGFTGTWDMQGQLYRELFIIEATAYAKSQEPGGLLGE